MFHVMTRSPLETSDSTFLLLLLSHLLLYLSPLLSEVILGYLEANM